MIMLDICVVIVNYNMKSEIDRCLASLYADSKDSGLVFKVVIVDNASIDGSKEFLLSKFPDLKYITLGENKGFGAAQNIGLASMKSKYYFVLNPDTYFFPEESALRKMFDLMEKDTKIGMLGPRIVYPDGSLQFSCYRFPTFWHPLMTRTKIRTKRGKQYHDHLLMKEVEHNYKMPVDWIMGSAMFVRGEALSQVGNFDERYWMYYEDSDLCRRFWEKGWPVYYFPEVTLEHIHHRGSAEVPGIIAALLKNKLARVHAYSWLKYMWKWKGNYKYYAPD